MCFVVFHRIGEFISLDLFFFSFFFFGGRGGGGVQQNLFIFPVESHLKAAGNC